MEKVMSSESSEQHKDSLLVSRNIVIDEHRTSVRLEPQMWDGLREICYRERQNIHEICTNIAKRKPVNASLTAAIRVFVIVYCIIMKFYRSKPLISFFKGLVRNFANDRTVFRLIAN